MGRRLDVLLGRTSKQTARLRSLLGLAVTRLGVVRGHRQVRCAQARGDVEQLLRLGHPDRALLRAEQVIREQSALDALLMLEAYCNLVAERAALLDAARGECPEELREAAAGLVYAAARCGDLPELQEVRRILAAKFGKEFASAASDLRSGCGINIKLVQKLSTRQPSLESRQTVLQEIAAEKGINVRVHEPPSEGSGSNVSTQRKAKQDDERIREPQVVNLEEDDSSADSAQRYKNVEAAAQAAFESAASAAAAAKAAMELSRGEPKGSGDRRKPGRTQMDEARKEETLDGKKFDKIGHVPNSDSEIEVLPDDEANHANIVGNELKHNEQRDPARRRPASVRTKWGF